MSDGETLNNGEETKEAEPTVTSPSGDTTPTVQMVPASQLMSLKAKYKSEADILKKSNDDLYGKNLNLESEKSSLEEQANRVSSLEAEVTETKNRLGLSEAARAYAEAGTTEQRRAGLATAYNIDPDVLKDKTSADMDSLEEALKLVSKPQTGQFAVTGGSGKTAPETPIERAAGIIADAEKHQGLGGGSFNKPPEAAKKD